MLITAPQLMMQERPKRYRYFRTTSNGHYALTDITLSGNYLERTSSQTQGEIRLAEPDTSFK